MGALFLCGDVRLSLWFVFVFVFFFVFYRPIPGLLGQLRLQGKQNASVLRQKKIPRKFQNYLTPLAKPLKISPPPTPFC